MFVSNVDSLPLGLAWLGLQGAKHVMSFHSHSIWVYGYLWRTHKDAGLSSWCAIDGYSTNEVR